jgi:hypothetical protein
MFFEKLISDLQPLISPQRGLTQFRRNQIQKLGPGFFFQELAGKGRGGSYRVLLLYAAHTHAKVTAFNYHPNTNRVQGLLNTIAYFIG